MRRRKGKFQQSGTLKTLYSLVSKTTANLFNQTKNWLFLMVVW